MEGQRSLNEVWATTFPVLAATRLTSYLVDDHPKGYPQFAAFMNCDDNFLMCRRFGFLHDRVLLYRQDELTQLERDLVEMDSLDAEEDPLSLQSRKRDDAREFELTRKGLIDKIDSKLKQYGKTNRLFLSFSSKASS